MEKIIIPLGKKIISTGKKIIPMGNMNYSNGIMVVFRLKNGSLRYKKTPRPGSMGGGVS